MEFAELFSSSGDMLGLILPIALPIILGFLLFQTYVEYMKEKFLSEQEYCLIRIIPPRDVFKSPVAMELFINALYQTAGEATPIDKYWRGKSRAWFSLEIASNDGEVGFYIWTRSSLKGYLEGQIYAQYPGIEVVEVEDYAERIDYESGGYSMFALEWKLTEPDPVPIKTYMDYGLNQHAEEEEKIDPITATLEFLGALQPGENAWIQIIVKAHKKEDKKKGTWFGKTDNWVDEAKELIVSLKKEGIYKDPDDPDARPVPMQTKAQEEKITAIERNISKLGFDVGIRGIYIAEKDSFNGVNIGGLIGSFKQYGSANLNGFKPGITTSTNYWWQDPMGTKIPAMKSQMFKDYKSRRYFNTSVGFKKRQKFVLNSEELATLFHFPGTVAGTPTLTRVKSRKGEAPSNLPI